MSSRLALPVSGPAHKDRDTYTRWLRERFHVPRVLPRLQKWGKEESTEGEHTGLKLYKRLQVNARIISIAFI